MGDHIGYNWLRAHFNIDPTQPVTITSETGTRRKTIHLNGGRIEIFPNASKPDGLPAAHLAFALKHEGVHLELLSRLFDRWEKKELESWINREPTGQYARKAGFFYEWLTGKSLSISGVTGNYRDALNPDEFITTTEGEKNSRWRINDNLPGNRFFCPMVRRTDLVKVAEAYDCQQHLDDMEMDFGTDVVMKSAVWLTLKESRASFDIEHEGNQKNRIHRFAQAMERYCGKVEAPLAADTIETLQNAILGTSTIRTGFRQSPVFVGSGTRERGNYVHYIAPPANDIAPMMGGLNTFLKRTEGQSPIARAAVASFGFVFIHPLADGNGRVSRFLINDILRRDKAVAAPYLLPISATISDSNRNRADYDAVLEHYSKPMMTRAHASVSFGKRRTYPDGIVSDFHFSDDDLLMPTWRYPDLTCQSEYLLQVIHQTIDYEMRYQMEFQSVWNRMLERVKDWLEGPDQDLSRIVRSIGQNGGEISNKLIKEFPVLADPDTAEAIKARAMDGLGLLPEKPSHTRDIPIKDQLEMRKASQK